LSVEFELPNPVGCPKDPAPLRRTTGARHSSDNAATWCGLCARLSEVRSSIGAAQGCTIVHPEAWELGGAEAERAT